MSTKTQVITIGTKPMAAILADWQSCANEANTTNKPTGLGWLTKKEIREATGFGICKTDIFVKGLVRSGRAEVYAGSDRNKNGVDHRQVWYKLRPGAVKQAISCRR